MSRSRSRDGRRDGMNTDPAGDLEHSEIRSPKREIFGGCGTSPEGGSPTEPIHMTAARDRGGCAGYICGCWGRAAHYATPRRPRPRRTMWITGESAHPRWTSIEDRQSRSLVISRSTSMLDTSDEMATRTEAGAMPSAWHATS
jgi:hypothetical protein